MKAYSQDLRDRVINLYVHENYSRNSISQLLNISYSTVYSWIKRYIKTGDYSSKQHLNAGRPPRFTDKQAILDYIKSNPDADGIEIRNAVAPQLPMNTFYDTLHRMKITYKKKNRNTNKDRKESVMIT